MTTLIPKFDFKDGGLTPAGAVNRPINEKLQETISVKDFGATGDGATDDTTAVLNALDYVKTINGILYFPNGNYIVQQAMQLDSGITVKGDGLASTTITRTSNTAETIDGHSVKAVFYVTGGWNHITDLNITGVNGSTTGNVTGILFGYNIAAKGSVKNVAINYMLHAVNEVTGVFLTTFENVQAVSCGYGFYFDSSNQKTSLTLTGCYCANTGPAYVFEYTNYSTIIDCAADNCNWGTLPANPYGSGFGVDNDPRGVYYFNVSDMTITDCGAEGCYGNGVIFAANTQLTINNIFSYGCSSTYLPDYATYPNYAVGPIQLSAASNKITYLNGFHSVWTNPTVTALSKPIADEVALNLDANLYPNSGPQLFMTNKSASTPSVKGTADASIYAYSWYTQYSSPVFNGNITNGSNGIITKAVKITGTGTVINIPITSQTSQNFKHYIKIKGIDGTSNGTNPYPFEATFAFSSLNAISTISSTGLWNVTTVAAGSGVSINVTLASSHTNPILTYEIISERPAYILTSTATIS